MRAKVFQPFNLLKSKFISQMPLMAGLVVGRYARKQKMPDSNLECKRHYKSPKVHLVGTGP